MALTGATTSANDYFFVSGDQWALANSPAAIDAPQAWSVATGYGVVVGDVDTGADFGNPDLQGKLIAGAQFLGCPGTGTGSLVSDPPTGTGQAAVQDDVGHGTMTTGIAVADTNNSQGIAAVAPAASALVVKVLRRTIQSSSNGAQYASGTGCDNDVGAGIEWAVDHGAQVINVSIGSDVPLTGSVSDITSAVSYAWNHDVAVALAAGNNQLPISDYTTISNEALVVGALGPTGATASYSTNNVGVNVYAPGGDSNSGSEEDIHHLVVSTSWPDPQFHGGEYAIGEGTSFAAPQASGVLALLRSCGLGGQAAVQRVKSVASSHSQHLDAGATLAGLKSCAAPAPSSTSAARNAGPGQGEASNNPNGASAGSTGPPTAASGVRASATSSQGKSDGAESPSPTGVISVTTPGMPPSAQKPLTGQGLNPVLVALLVLLVSVGAPAAAWLAHALRASASSRQG